MNTGKGSLIMRWLETDACMQNNILSTTVLFGFYLIKREPSQVILRQRSFRALLVKDTLN
jgi:hypothetical protein